MTFAEINRAIASKERIRKSEMQEKATFDYVLAQLITKGTNIALTGKGELPAFSDIYGGLLANREEHKEKQAEKEKAKDELSALRFQLFAQSFNDRFKGASVKNE